MIEVAERSLASLAERDRLKARFQHEEEEALKPETSDDASQVPAEEQQNIPTHTTD